MAVVPLTMQYGTVKTPEAERIPIAIFSDLIQRWLETYKAEHDETSSNDHTTRYVEKQDLRHEGSYNVLAFHCDMSARRLRLIKSGKFDVGCRRNGTLRYVDWIPFNIADKIVVGILGPDAWHTEPLNQFYEAA